MNQNNSISHDVSDNPSHPFHIVRPSPWPLLSSLMLMLLLGSIAASLHLINGDGGIADVLCRTSVFASGIGFISCVYCWLKDITGEAAHDNAHNSTVRRGLRIGFAAFLFSELVLFDTFGQSITNFHWIGPAILTDDWLLQDTHWPPKGITVIDPWNIPLLNTFILLLSGTTVTWAHHRMKTGDSKGASKVLLLTVSLGVLFTVIQAFEYHHASFAVDVANGISNIYPSTFFLLTGFHGLHVIAGGLFLFIIAIRACKNRLTQEQHLGFEFAAWYWHMVDVVWIFLFIFLYCT